MRVSLAEIQQYARTLASLSDVAEERACSSIALWMTMHPEATVAECRDFAIAAVGRVVEQLGDAASVEAAKLHDEVMAAEGVDVPAASIYDGPDDGKLEGTVRRLAGRLAGDSPDADGFARQAGRLASEMTRDAAGTTVRRSVERDAGTRKGREVRYAIVPQRPDPCGYCVLLASRGFDYLGSERAEAARHRGCTCLVVPGVRGRTTVEGYDQKGMYDRYLSCRKAIEHDLGPGWERLGKAGQAAYEDGFNDYCLERIVAEMNTRDRAWLKTGIPCYRSKEAGAKPLKKERDVGTALLGHGFNVEFVKEINRTGVKTADAWLNDDLWEFKVPEGWKGEYTIRNQFYKAQDKGTHRLLISATMNDAPMDEMRKWVTTTFEKGDYPQITEVMIMSSDGESLERLFRQHWRAPRHP